MLLWKKISFVVFAVIFLALLGVSLFLLLGDDYGDDIIEESICETSRLYLRNRHLVDLDMKPHFLKNIELTLRPPPVEVERQSRATVPEWAWLSQRVDHFNPTDLRTWQMRYMVSNEFYEDGGPIFVFLGGEWEISSDYLLTGQLYDMAKDHKGYMFYTEHRYYGQSMPTEFTGVLLLSKDGTDRKRQFLAAVIDNINSGNLCTENLQYLSAVQALADIVYFIDYQKQNIPSLRNSKVVVVGGSYSAVLATWARMKYPHAIDAALASSAPLLAIADFYQFYEVVSVNLQKASQNCVDIISEAFSDIEQALITSAGIAKVSEDFNTCQILNTTEPDRAQFFESLTAPFAGLVQYAVEGQIEEQCDLLTSYNGTSYEKFVQYMNQYYDGYCLTNYEYFATYLENPLPKDILRPWYYQKCTEYGFFHTTNSDNQYFGKNTVNVELYQKLCDDVYGIDVETMNMGIERTNLMYGALEPEVTKVVSVHGTVDPYHSIGVLSDINEEAPVFVVDGTSHCQDLLSVSDDDLPDMRAAKIRAKELIADWIK